MEIKNECIEVSNNSKIVCSENRRKITFNNISNKSVSKIRVDDCQITEGVRCDYLVTFDNEEHFVELKGKNLVHAFEQLKRTIELLKASTCNKRICYVISSQSPLVSSEIQVQKIKFRKHFVADLIVKNNNYVVNI